MNKLSKNNLLLLAASVLIIIFLLIWVVYNYVYFANGQVTFGKIAAHVGSGVITQDQYDSYYPIYNGAKQCKSGKKETSSQDEVVKDLVRTNNLKAEAASKSISISKTEVQLEEFQEVLLNEGRQQDLLTKCGWTQQQFDQAVEIKLTKQKLGVS